MVILQVHCYGHYNPSIRSKIEMEGLDEYIDQTVKLIMRHLGSIGFIVVSGGMRDEDGISEAASFSEELKKRLSGFGVTVRIVLDEESTSTIGIVQKIFLLHRQDLRFAAYHLWLVCDKARSLKTRFLAFQMARGKIAYRIFGFERRDSNLRSNWFFQLLEIVVMTLFSAEVTKAIIESSPERKKPRS